MTGGVLAQNYNFSLVETLVDKCDGLLFFRSRFRVKFFAQLTRSGARTVPIPLSPNSLLERQTSLRSSIRGFLKMTFSSLQAQAPRVILSGFSPSNCTEKD